MPSKATWGYWGERGAGKARGAAHRRIAARAGRPRLDLRRAAGRPMSGAVRRDLPIVNEKGLHARASARFVETVERFDAAATVRRDGMEASGDSIMGLLMLAASKGSSIEVETRGAEAEALADALAALVANRFGEDM
jgi:phosphocarrier protein